ncbi:hypothetical protein [Streptomyces sp. NPDC002540]
MRMLLAARPGYRRKRAYARRCTCYYLPRQYGRRAKTIRGVLPAVPRCASDSATSLNDRELRAPPTRRPVDPTTPTRRCSPCPSTPRSPTTAPTALCPAGHKHTSSGKPLHADCPGRTYTQAVCSCGNWEMKQRGKGYVNECCRRHLADHAEGPKVLRDLLPLDAF